MRCNRAACFQRWWALLWLSVGVELFDPSMKSGLVQSFILSTSFKPRLSANPAILRPLTGCRLSTATPESDTTEPQWTQLRVSELRTMLKEMNVNFSDCFDKESLVQRLKDARQQSRGHTSTFTPPTDHVDDRTERPAEASSTTSAAATSSTAVASLDEIRHMPVRALREELAARHLRWAGMLEKEDLVQAVWKARQAAAQFSVTGRITPGQVADLTGEELERELSSTSTPILLDVYATWCGPCQLMAAQLGPVAAALGPRVRVIKLDSDQYPAQASRFRVQGLPTLLLFGPSPPSGPMTEVDRVEGAMMKDQLLQWVENKLG